ncbi:hypothetical protein PF005_g6522 [Phytophthora fragariae]|uniref:SWIM-type domain-containing protein n=1 Tax=Phytophthora fragariae TaxID=53985 RepID=A0A6A3SWW9_9STRA|nr:hypothetical protein PF009_g720 [Phytophthora fragariae]KAE9019978.1 hypothetical protein PF011_g5606 [Phytophthora fragariae]KAE9125330.1 hypothetical protein PF007_g6399 [Phytophthora fragariae]KAE9149866.1 hypothetical protein PF006_g5697 [Phytophthora fragariae]KAE9222874.1 hypothetical protein PF005_g6522 [Phytophthora fragariae]
MFVGRMVGSAVLVVWRSPSSSASLTTVPSRASTCGRHIFCSCDGSAFFSGVEPPCSHSGLLLRASTSSLSVE